MDSIEINRILKKHCLQHFHGVFPANDFEISKVPCFLVLNTDESDKPGQHWVCLYINEERSEFFDSQGLAPFHYHNYWHEALLQISNSYCYNTNRLQETDSNVCGQFCIAYVLLRSYGFSFESILKMLKDINLEAFISRLF